MDFLRNLFINLKATGPAAVIIAWVIGVTLLGIFGNGDIASRAMSVLNVGGVILILTLCQKIK